MTEEELKNKCKERAKIFQQAMESCKSSSPIDCIEWFADRIAELEMTVGTLRTFSNEQATCIERLTKENSELKVDNDARKFAMTMSEKVEKQLREENAKLKDEWQEQVQKATDEGYARTLQTIQLSKAKELLKRAQGYTENLDDEADKLYDEIEQFLKENK